MRLSLDAEVRTREGAEAGRVHLAVVDPQRGDLTHLVIRTGPFFGRDVLVPREALDRATMAGDVVRLDLTEAEFESLPEFDPTAFRLAAEDRGSDQHGLPGSAYVYPAGHRESVRPEMVESVSAPVLVTSRPDATDVAGAEAQIKIGRDATVVDQQGEHIGVVDDVQFDSETGALRGLVVRLGGTFATLFESGDSVQVSADLIERVVESDVFHSARTVHLSISKDQLKSQIR